jgi:phosphopantothenoylcysteine decarboxylase / phosphopantothenate---cysteine ligase
VSNKRVLITAGPTRAYLDDFRFISNHSTGQLGYELAKLLLKRGVIVSVVVGKCEAPFEKLRLHKLHRVETFEEMRVAVMKECRAFKPDWAVFSAAVLDYVPSKRSKGKTKSDGIWTLQLTPTPKIIDEVERRFPHIQRIGFKLEAKDPGKGKAIKFGLKELKRRKLQGLVLNYLPNIKATSHAALLFQENGEWIETSTKREIARWLTGRV